MIRAAPLFAAPLLTALLLAALLVAGAQAPAEPTTYRDSEYRAPVPATVNGRPALTTAQAATLWRQGSVVFVDTLPQPPRPAGLPPETIWHPKPRFDIPGSIWLPDTGYGVLPDAMSHYFADSLKLVTEGDSSRHLVFYCLANCWMSWNATKRALSIGYVNAEWFAAGTDGWAEAQLPLEPREPVPRP